MPEVTSPEMTAGAGGDGVDGCEQRGHDWGPGSLLEPGLPVSDGPEQLWVSEVGKCPKPYVNFMIFQGSNISECDSSRK